jgi:surface-anchored protein
MKTNHTRMLSATTLPLLALCAVAPSATLAQVAIIDTHIDIGIAGPSAGSSWGFHIHDGDWDEEYAPSAAFFYINPAHATLTQPAGAQWSFIGQTVGAPIYVLPQGQNANLPFLGFAAEEVPANTFDSTFNSDSRVNATGRWIGFTVTSVSGPGEFSIWQTDGFGNPRVWVSTFEGGLTAADTVFIQQGGHAHFNWGFTAPGTYEVTLVASGFIGGVQHFSDPATFTFSTSNPIPEPAAFAALAGLAALGLAATRRRRLTATA